MEFLQRTLKWAERNERHLGAIVFVAGFVTDLVTFGVLSIALVNIAFLAYLVVAIICTFGTHLVSHRSETPTLTRRISSVMFPLVAQYSIGSLLSGCLIFYTKSANVFASWPFLLFLVLIFFGNEYFRTYYKHVAFQVVLLFFAMYAYAIFALPLVVNQLGPWVFVCSTVLSCVSFALFLYLLKRTRPEEFRKSFQYILPGSLSVLFLMNVFYFTGIMPPIPLTLPESGVYHSFAREDGNYVVSAEAEQPWWNVSEHVVHHVPGTPLYAYSSVSAPVRFSTYIVHVWERYDAPKQKWVERSRVSFNITGGRDGGYRGYSELADAEEGKWRVRIQTPEGQTIGRLSFTVVTVSEEPLLHLEQK
ncbi:MAG: DUF2914 domain-containing protein [Patescibacteria group bacterium]